MMHRVAPATQFEKKMMSVANMPHKAHGPNAAKQAKNSEMLESTGTDAVWEQQLPE
jgi:hypothetical protein